VAFEIGPREDAKTWEVPARGEVPAYKGELHKRVINGTPYIFGRFTYETGAVAVQAIVQGRSTKANPDVHYWAGQPKG
jgi:hypothetical protein